MAENQPSKTFWQPLSFGLVLLIFLGAQLVANLALVALREGLGVDLPQWIAGGIGGAGGVICIALLARRRLARTSSK